MLQYMNDGGIIMWIIAALSVVAAAVAAERFLFFRQQSAEPETLEKRLGEAIKNGDMEEAKAIAASSAGSLNRLFTAALCEWQDSPQEMELLLAQQIRREIFRWEKKLYVLELIGKTAPLLGLLGTVLGMVEMFGTLHAGAQISASAVTGGIWKALYTTVAGLTVAIPVIFVYGLLNSRIDNEEETLKRGADFITRLRMGCTDGKTRKE